MNIARHRPKTLTLASRTLSKLETVAKLVTESSGLVPVIIELDLSSQASIRMAATKVKEHVASIDVLINNAAVVSSDRRETKDGLELTFGTNHIGHWLWTSLLMPLLLSSAEGLSETARVVNVTSLGYRLSPIRFHDYNFEGQAVPPEEEPPQGLPPHMKPNMKENRPYQGFCAYGQSKTANILHCVSFNERYRAKGLRAFAVHPGCKHDMLLNNFTPANTRLQLYGLICPAISLPKTSKSSKAPQLHGCQSTKALRRSSSQLSIQNFKMLKPESSLVIAKLKMLLNMPKTRTLLKDCGH